MNSTKGLGINMVSACSDQENNSGVSNVPDMTTAKQALRAPTASPSQAQTQHECRGRDWLPPMRFGHITNKCSMSRNIAVAYPSARAQQVPGRHSQDHVRRWFALATRCGGGRLTHRRMLPQTNGAIMDSCARQSSTVRVASDVPDNSPVSYRHRGNACVQTMS